MMRTGVSTTRAASVTRNGNSLSFTTTRDQRNSTAKSTETTLVISRIIQTTSHEYQIANKTTAISEYSNTSEPHYYQPVGNGLTPSFLSVEHAGIIAGCITALVSLAFLGIVTLVVIVKRHRTESSARAKNIGNSNHMATPVSQSNPRMDRLKIDNSYQLPTAPEVKDTRILAIAYPVPQIGERCRGIMPSIPSSSDQYTYSEVGILNRSLEMECGPPQKSNTDSKCQGPYPDGSIHESTYSSLRLENRCIVNPYDTFSSASATRYRQECENDELTSRHLSEVQYSQQGHKNLSPKDIMMINELSSEFKDDTQENRLELGNDFLMEQDIYVNNFKAFQDDFKLNGQKETLNTGTTANHSQVVSKKDRNKDFHDQI